MADLRLSHCNMVLLCSESALNAAETIDPSWSVATSSPSVRYQQKRPLSSRQLTGTSGQFRALN